MCKVLWLEENWSTRLRIHGDACVKRLGRWGRVQIVLLSEAKEVESSHFPPYSHFHRKLRFKRVSDLPKGSIDIKQ